MKPARTTVSWRVVITLSASVLVAAVLFLPYYVRVDPQEPSAAAFLPPSLAHPFGTDDLGRDLMTALVFGGRASLMSGSVVTIGATLLGLVVGVIAGMASHRTDRLLTRLMDVSQIAPRFFLALLASAGSVRAGFSSPSSWPSPAGRRWHGWFAPSHARCEAHRSSKRRCRWAQAASRSPSVT